jgi:hypothetical protein
MYYAFRQELWLFVLTELEVEVAETLEADNGHEHFPRSPIISTPLSFILLRIHTVEDAEHEAEAESNPVPHLKTL